MAKEIERKYLVVSESYISQATSSFKIIQGYLFDTPKGILRVRIKGESAFITVKSANKGIERNEWEYPVPVSDAMQMLELAGKRIIRKTRYIVPFGSHIWEVDAFEDSLKGLVLAEIELEDRDAVFAVPDFIGEEVSDDPRYFNSSLAGSLAE